MSGARPPAERQPVERPSTQRPSTEQPPVDRPLADPAAERRSRPDHLRAGEFAVPDAPAPPKRPSDPTERRRAERRGRRAEAIAALWLRLTGHLVLARGHGRDGGRSGRSGEADIVARRGRTVMIVEVKARPTYRAALDAVAWRRVEAAGDDWLARRSDRSRLDVRYDLVWVPVPLRPWRLPRHVRGAWHP